MTKPTIKTVSTILNQHTMSILFLPYNKMSSRSLDGVVSKIDASSSNQNLYKSLTREDRINMQATPLSNNATGSAKGLVGDFTPSQFQSFDMGRDTYATLAQEQDCYHKCMLQCVAKVAPGTQRARAQASAHAHTCHTVCKESCVVDTTKDFI
jgi:hypothetical protein